MHACMKNHHHHFNINFFAKWGWCLINCVSKSSYSRVSISSSARQLSRRWEAEDEEGTEPERRDGWMEWWGQTLQDSTTEKAWSLFLAETIRSSLEKKPWAVFFLPSFFGLFGRENKDCLYLWINWKELPKELMIFVPSFWGISPSPKWTSIRTVRFQSPLIPHSGLQGG